MSWGNRLWNWWHANPISMPNPHCHFLFSFPRYMVSFTSFGIPWLIASLMSQSYCTPFARHGMEGCAASYAAGGDQVAFSKKGNFCSLASREAPKCSGIFFQCVRQAYHLNLAEHNGLIKANNTIFKHLYLCVYSALWVVQVWEEPKGMWQGA